MSEHDFEPVRGLPSDLPEGEFILWQGAPDWVLLALDAFKVGWVSAYFFGLVVWRFIDNIINGVGPAVALSTALAVMPLAAIALVILAGLALINARTTVYTVTNKRVVMRFGAALTKAINIPFQIIESASSNLKPDGRGNIAIKLSPPNRIALLLLWPHVRSGTMRQPEPMFRCLRTASIAAPILAEALRLAHSQALATTPISDNPHAEPEYTQPVLA